MLPVNSFAEPSYFNLEVRIKGNNFLAGNPHPNSKEWSEHAYWQICLPDMRKLYNGICNYCSTWIPHSTGQHSVDHFIDKNGTPTEAYEWHNYRYASSRFNSRKSTRTIIDPIGLPPETFILDFANFYIKTNPSLSDPSLKRLADNTINFLKFNDDDELVNERFQFFDDYKNGAITFRYLQSHAPFLASEIERQGLK